MQHCAKCGKPKTGATPPVWKVVPSSVGTDMEAAFATIDGEWIQRITYTTNSGKKYTRFVVGTEKFQTVREAVRYSKSMGGSGGSSQDRVPKK